MKTYQTNDGDVFRVRDDAELVEQLRKSARNPTASAEEFMTEVGDRIGMESGAVVETTDCAAFVRDLIKVGYLKEIES